MEVVSLMKDLEIIRQESRIRQGKPQIAWKVFESCDHGCCVMLLLQHIHALKYLLLYTYDDIKLRGLMWL